MSTLWTPDGERPVGASGGDDAEDRTDEGPAGSHDELRRFREELLATPAAAVVANHCYGLFELATLHLSAQPPQFEHAQLAIDALGALIEGLGARLGEAEGDLKAGLAQIRLAFVQIRAANLGAPAAGEGEASGG